MERCCKTSLVQRLNTFYSIERVGNKKIYQPRFNNKNVSINVLVHAGFFYEGELDTVRCQSCQVRFWDWQEGDDPIQILDLCIIMYVECVKQLRIMYVIKVIE